VPVVAGSSAYWPFEEEHMRRREYGSLRHLPSGRRQARYPGSDGRLRPAPQTFPSRQAAAGWLASLQTDLARVASTILPNVGQITEGVRLKVGGNSSWQENS
jgi:hypothetical protein